MSEIIKEVYETNFGTAYEAYKEAVKKDSSIRLQDVKDYMNSREEHNLNIRSIIVLLVLVLDSSLKQILWMCLREMVMVLGMGYVLFVISQKWSV